MYIKKYPGIIFFYKNIFNYAKKFPLLMTFLTFALVIQNAFFLIAPMLLKSAFDEALGRKDIYWSLIIFICLLVGLAILLATYVLTDFLSTKIGVAVINKLRFSFYTKIQNMSLGALNNITSSKLLSCFSEDIALVRNATIFSLWYSIAYLLFIPVGIGVLFYLNWPLTLVVLFLIPISMIISRICYKHAAQNIDSKKDADMNLLSFVTEDIATQLTNRILGLFSFRSKMFEANIKATEQIDAHYHFFTALSKSIISSGQMGIRLGILAIGSLLVLTGHLTIGVLIGFSVLLDRVTACIHMFASQMPKLFQASGELSHILEIINHEVDQSEEQIKPVVRNFSHHICFNKVSFRYPNSQFTLHDIDLKFFIGQSVAIAGPSGSGKSTLIRLLLGQEIPTRGKVEIDMCDLKNYDLNSFLNQVGVVLQTPDLFNMSIADNIRMGKLDATNEEIIIAAKAAEIHNEIMLLKDSYDSIIGEQNIDLSVSQHQRIAIARALIKNPQILVLDEATTGLDPINQIAINKTLVRQFKDRTIIRITHDLSETIGMDKIYLLHEGRIISTGTHEELLQSTGSLF